MDEGARKRLVETLGLLQDLDDVHEAYGLLRDIRTRLELALERFNLSGALSTT
jgi:hypothetical protein